MDRRLLLDGEWKGRLRVTPKAGGLDGQGVRPRSQRRQHVAAGGVGFGGVRQITVDVGQGDGGVRNRRLR